MKLDTISTIAEIAPFYGELDEVYKLMKRLCIQTNQMWDTVCVQLSKITNRKCTSLYCECKEYVEILIKCPLILTLFDLSSFEINSEVEYELISKLLFDFKNPQMIHMNLGLCLSCDRDTLLKSSNYKDYIKFSDFELLDLYNNIIKIAQERCIDLKNIKSYAFINEIESLKIVKFIHSIIFPCNEENNPDTMIQKWKNLIQLQTLQFRVVKLIWDKMKFDDFIKIYRIVSNEKIKVHVYCRKELQSLINFLEEPIYNQRSKSFIELTNDEYILWSDTLKESQINIKKCYIHANTSTFQNEMSNIIINYSNNNVVKRSNKIVISQEDLFSLVFELIPNINLSNTRRNHDCAIKIFERGVSRRNKRNNCIYILNQKISTLVDYEVFFRCFGKDKLLYLEIENIKLNLEEVQKYLEEIEQCENVQGVSFLIDNSSTALIFLKNCVKLSFLKVIILKIKKACSLFQNYELGKTVDMLKQQGKCVKILISSFTQATYYLK